MVFPTGGAVVSNSGVDLSGVIQGSMRRYKVQVADGQMQLSSNDTKGMVVTPLWVWSVLVHLRSKRIPCLQGLTSGWVEGLCCRWG